MHARIFEISRDLARRDERGLLRHTAFRGWDIRSVETLSWRDAVNVAKKLSRLDLHGTMKKSKWIPTPIVHFQDAYKLVWLGFLGQSGCDGVRAEDPQPTRKRKGDRMRGNTSGPDALGEGYGVGCFVPDGSQFAQDIRQHLTAFRTRQRSIHI